LINLKILRLSWLYNKQQTTIIPMNINVKAKKRKGFALTEVLMAIAVIIIVGIAAYPLYTSSQENSDVEAAINKLVNLKSLVDENFTNANEVAQFGGNNMQQQMVQLGLVPDMNYYTYKNLTIAVVPSYGLSGITDSNPNDYIYNISALNSFGENPQMTTSECIKLVKAFLPIFSNVYFGQQANAIKTNGVVVATIEQQAQYCANTTGTAPDGEPVIFGSDSPLNNS
jgi:Tfp pilus assembly protein PilE